MLSSFPLTLHCEDLLDGTCSHDKGAQLIKLIGDWEHNRISFTERLTKDPQCCAVNKTIHSTVSSLFLFNLFIPLFIASLVCNWKYQICSYCLSVRWVVAYLFNRRSSPSPRSECVAFVNFSRVNFFFPIWFFSYLSFFSTHFSRIWSLSSNVFRIHLEIELCSVHWFYRNG